MKGRVLGGRWICYGDSLAEQEAELAEGALQAVMSSAADEPLSWQH